MNEPFAANWEDVSRLLAMTVQPDMGLNDFGNKLPAQHWPHWWIDREASMIPIEPLKLNGGITWAHHVDNEGGEALLEPIDELYVAMERVKVKYEDRLWAIRRLLQLEREAQMDAYEMQAYRRWEEAWG